MKINKYKYNDPVEDGWNFDEIELQNVNLFVGDTATGKTRLINTIFNLGKIVVRENENVMSGEWKIEFEVNNRIYFWEIKIPRNSENIPEIESEKLYFNDGNNKVDIISRNYYDFIYLGNKLPKMSLNKTGIQLLKNEEEISQIYDGFCKIIQRKFSEDILTREKEINIFFLKPYKKEIISNLEELYKQNFQLNQRLFILKNYFADTYRKISEWYINIFPFINEIDVKDFSDFGPGKEENTFAPIFCIKERDSDNWIPLMEFSSGMLKILILLVDTLLLPEGGISIIDEYENSLGINSIGFLPSLIYEISQNNQFFISSHHPYIINEIPISSWFVFHRKNMNVEILFGKKLINRYGKSSQSAFNKLINDDFYSDGIG